MNIPITVLIVEDSRNDKLLILAELLRGGFIPEWKRVETEQDYLAEIQRLPDIILSDYSLPQFSGLRAFKLLKESGLDIPFILISGTVGEETAVAAMKEGVTDYLLKDRLARLGMAVRHALEQKDLRAEHRRGDAKLRLFRTLIDRSHDGIEVIDPKTGCFIDVNETTCMRLGYTREELLGKNVSDVYQDHSVFASWRDITVIGENDSKIVPGLCRRKDSSTFPVEAMVRHVKLDGEYLIASVRDITERTRAEEALRLFESAVAQSKESIMITDAQLELPGPKIIFVNPAFTQMTGYDTADVIGKTPRLLQGPQTDKAVLKRLRDNLQNGESFAGEAVNYRKDGTRFELEWQITPLRNTTGEITHFVATQHDVTARKSLEAQFRQSQKMEGIGQLAGGVAHDFNNILAVIQMQAELLKVSGSLSAVQTGYANEIGITVQRAAALTRQLLLFSSREVFQPRDLEVNAAIATMTKMLGRILGENIQVQLKPAASPVFVHADPSMIDQILLNLTVNARDAMPDGGQLTIETSLMDFDELATFQSIHARPGLFVCLAISDTGTGISPDILPKIFEPFFTTKAVGRGTGLGLATVFGIVQQHLGWIDVQSQLGQGTTFQIYLPRLAKSDASKVTQSASVAVHGGNETILLAEDDRSLRISVRQTLSRLGYRILEAPTGSKAMEVWRENRSEIALLLTDLVMPDGMNGKELAGRLLQENPNLNVVYMSGYSAEVVGEDFPLSEGVNFLAKPFDGQKLANTVRNCLDKCSSQ